MADLQHFTRGKQYLVCVDSDGCAMDTMDIKHFRCFGPCMIEQWGLQEWDEAIQVRWNEINLYTMTRGINRFKGLAMALEEIDQMYCPIEGAHEFADWAESAPQLSNAALQSKIAAGAAPVFAKALAWSQAVNEAINALPDESKKPFAGAAQGLAAAHAVADVAVVSSANREAVLEEWQRCGLLENVDVVCCQDDGSKAHCIEVLLSKGYDPACVLMVGDAPGDRDAACKNGVHFYPILVRSEAASWAELVQQGLARLTGGSYAAYGQQKELEFLHNLGG